METLEFRFPAERRTAGRAHVGVVASGDLEVLMEAVENAESLVTVQTSVSSYSKVWEATVGRFCERHGAALRIEIHDFGATPGMVLLRLQQAFDSMTTETKEASVPGA